MMIMTPPSKLYQLSLLFAAMVLFCFQSGQAQEDNYFQCPTGSQAIEWFADGRLSELPNYSESAGARVQRQHPDTRMFAQAKFIFWDERSVGICQYSNHVGVVAQIALADAVTDAHDDKCDNGSCLNGSYWRSEWAESLPEQDKLGREQLHVCMQDIEGVNYPSIGCRFLPGSDK